MAFSTGYDMKNELKFSDGLGKTYIAIATVWSAILFCGCLFLILKCDLPFIRIRNLPLTISTIAILHVYWVLCLVAYGLNGFFPCATEYWIMNIYLPLGIALFHLSNSKLLHVAVLQRKYTSMDPLLGEKRGSIGHYQGVKKYAHIIQSYTTYQKTKWSIVLGMSIQLVCALVIFLMSQKFHPGFGVIGEALPETPLTKQNCRKGWEWIPSIAWQFLWAWLYAPYLLWKVRHIEDTHGWRTQTVVCCLAGLPASPMWLLALYLPQMSKINQYFIPPLWFVPSIFVIEVFMIFLPCWHIVKHDRMKNETLDIIAQWERHKNGSSLESDSANVTQSPRRMSHKTSIISASSNRKTHSHMYTMAALDKALQTNSTPLLLYAALKDFSGENISFLNHVQEWNTNWPQLRSPLLRTNTQSINARIQHRQFIKAVEIYSSFVSLRYSNFPINISHAHLKKLETVFEASASIVNEDHTDSLNSITPFDNYSMHTHELESSQGRDELSMVSTAIDGRSSAFDAEMNGTSKQSTIVSIYKVKDLGDKLPKSLLIPAEFDPDIFSDAVESVKYMVLTNTWPKFVDAGYAASMDKGTKMERIQGRLGECGIGRSRVCSF